MKWLIYAPGYTSMSGGIAALHSLCDRLNRIGESARLAPMHDQQTALRPGWHTSWDTDEPTPETIVVYPEITDGNPLGGKRVVRWIMNRPGYVGDAATGYGPDDMLVAFTAAIGMDGPVLHLPTTDPGVFHQGHGPRTGAALWIGKNTAPATTIEHRPVVEITRSWPVPQSAYADLLRSVEVLFSCDSLSAVNLEATLCGTPVLLFPDRLWSKADLARSECWLGVGWVGDDLDALRGEAQKAHPAYSKLYAGCGNRLREFVGRCEQWWR